jgi:hypothetical protein
MKSSKASCAECPSSEMLSSWYDRELRDCRIDEHVATCDECRRVIAAYHSLDNMLSSNLGMGGRSEVIIRSVLDQLKRPLLLRFPVYKLSLVAGLVIIATTLVVAINKLPENGVAANTLSPDAVDATATETDTVAATTATTAPEVTDKPAGLPQVPTVGETRSTFAPASRHGRVFNNNPSVLVRSIGGNGRIELMSMENSGRTPNAGVWTENLNFKSGNRKQAGIANRQLDRQRNVGNFVRHVWLVNDTASPLKALKMYTESDDELLDQLIARASDRYLLQMMLSDKDLQSLVNRFDALEFNLLSPSEPQPSDYQTLKFTGKNVKYEIDIIRKE